MPGYMKFPMVVLLTTGVWLLVTFLTKPEEQEVLEKFYQKTNPGGPGWKKIISIANANGRLQEIDSMKGWSVPAGILAMLFGLLLIYGILFTTGYIIYGEFTSATFTGIIATIAGIGLIKTWGKIKETVL